MAWGALISREMLICSNIRFAKNAYPREDLVFNLNLLDVHFRGVFVDAVSYIYRYAVAGSLSNSVRYRLAANFPEIYSLLLPYTKRCFSGNVGQMIASEEYGTRHNLLITPLRLTPPLRKEYFKLLEKFVPQIPAEGSWRNPSGILTKLYNHCRPVYRVLMAGAYHLIPKTKRILK